MSYKNYSSRAIRGKLRVCRYLKESSRLQQYVPRTVAFTRDHLKMMAGEYSVVYVKPDVGSLGVGIFKLKRLDSGYELKEVVGKRQLTHHMNSITHVYDAINRKKRGKMIAQQGITLGRVNGRPYDIRVMVQRKPGGAWTCTGYMVKVGASGKIVTNYYQGGEIWTLRKLHRQLQLSAKEAARRTGKLKAAALDIARELSGKQSGMHEMGIDFAYDTNGRLWVLEVNSNHPQFHPLKRLDRAAYNKMKQYAAAYGRHNAK